MKVKTILLPVDFSEQGAAAAQHAAGLARHFGAGLALLHVNPINGPAVRMTDDFSGPIDTGWITVLEAGARRQLEEYHQTDFAGIAVSKTVLTGDPASLIVQFANQEKPDLIVMPTHGYGPFRRFLLGSATAKVLHDVDTPVWTGAHLQKTSPAWKRLESVICAIDFRTAEPVLVWARDFAAEFNAELIVVHAVREMEPEDPTAIGAAQARELIACLQRKLAVPGEILIEEGAPSEVVQAAATRRSADVAVIGRSPQEGVWGRLRPNAYSIVRDAPCPVVSV